jgi:hypothetical protein
MKTLRIFQLIEKGLLIKKVIWKKENRENLKDWKFLTLKDRGLLSKKEAIGNLNKKVKKLHSKLLVYQGP